MTKLKNIFQDFWNDRRGNFSIFAGFSILTIVIAVGVGVDITRVMHAKQKSQAVADSIAIAASVYIDQNGQAPTSSTDGFVEGVSYSARQLGYDFFGSDDVTFTVTYDTVDKEARVLIGGTIPTTFMRVAHRTAMDFQAKSTAKYKESDILDPASIMFVLDNSGSMWFDDKPIESGESSGPADAVRRIDALKSAITDLRGRLADIDSGIVGERFVRTGMMTYNHDIISSTSVDMKWGTMSTSQINAMTPGGSTNSSPPMTEAWSQLNSDHSYHLNETGKTPLKFLIFMTDGNNTVGHDMWVPEDDTNHWRRSVTKQRCRWYWGQYRCWNYSDYEYFPSDGPSETEIPDPNGSGWEEGKFYLSSDWETQNTCNTMIAAGVKVYSIGFALDAGTYETNDWGYYSGQTTRNVTTDTKNKSVALLSACASEGDHFILAEDTEALTEAFEKIGNDILMEVIRLAN